MIAYPCCFSMCAQLSSKLAETKLQKMQTQGPMGGGASSSSSSSSPSPPSSDSTSIEFFSLPTTELLCDGIVTAATAAATAALSGAAAPSSATAMAEAVAPPPVVCAALDAVAPVFARAVNSAAAVCLTASLCFFDWRCWLYLCPKQHALGACFEDLFTARFQYLATATQHRQGCKSRGALRAERRASLMTPSPPAVASRSFYILHTYIPPAGVFLSSLSSRTPPHFPSMTIPNNVFTAPVYNK